MSEVSQRFVDTLASTPAASVIAAAMPTESVLADSTKLQHLQSPLNSAMQPKESASSAPLPAGACSLPQPALSEQGSLAASSSSAAADIDVYDELQLGASRSGLQHESPHMLGSEHGDNQLPSAEAQLPRLEGLSFDLEPHTFTLTPEPASSKPQDFSLQPQLPIPEVHPVSAPAQSDQIASGPFSHEPEPLCFMPEMLSPQPSPSGPENQSAQTAGTDSLSNESNSMSRADDACDVANMPQAADTAIAQATVAPCTTVSVVDEPTLHESSPDVKETTSISVALDAVPGVTKGLQRGTDLEQCSLVSVLAAQQNEARLAAEECHRDTRDVETVGLHGNAAVGNSGMSAEEEQAVPVCPPVEARGDSNAGEELTCLCSVVLTGTHMLCMPQPL